MQEYIKEKTRLHRAHAQVIGSIKKHIKFLEQELKTIEEALKEQILSDTNLFRKLEILKGVPGVGDVLAQTIITYLPEIGILSREAVSSLAGIAPMEAGKPAKVALTACMRKLLCILNSMVRENRTWRFE